MKEYADYGVAGGTSYGGSTKSYKGYSCYESHPVLKLAGGTLAGGSCINPIHEDADVYVGLDQGMRVQKYQPWEVEREVTQFLFPITDMCAPSDPKKFSALVEYLCNQLQSGKKVHAGCIGGHGRTGTLFAAMFAVLNNDKEAIETVRKLYCKKAVESDSQIVYLNKHFGINKVAGSKSHSTSAWGGSYGSSSSKTPTAYPKVSGGKELPSTKSKSTVFSSASRTWNAVKTTKKLVGELI